MIEKDVLSLSLKKKSVIDYDKIYSIAKSWAEGLDIDLTETSHKEKGDIELEWNAEKSMTSYIKSGYKIQLFIISPSSVEIVKEGKKKKMKKAIVKLSIKSKIITDSDKKWDGSDIKKSIEKFFNKFVYAGTISKHKKEIEAQTLKLFNLYKEELEVET